MKALQKVCTVPIAACLLLILCLGATSPDYPEAHPPVGEQPHRPAGYIPFHYSMSPAELLQKETPAFLERAHAAWDQTQEVIAKGPYHAEHDSIATHPCPEWFVDAKFGMFVDWGPWSVAGWAPQAAKATYPDWYERRMSKEYRDYHLKTWGEDIRPDDLIQLMRSDEFHSQGLADLARDAGMRYVVPFLKHHGGYSLWKSSFTHRNSVEWGLKRDFAKELSDACQTDGLKFGPYVSLGEWSYPVIKDGKLWTVNLREGNDRKDNQPRAELTDATPFVSGKVPVNDYSRDYLVPSLKELIDNIHPDMLWFDGEWEAAPDVWRSPDIVAYYYDRAAAAGQEVCVNDRMGVSTRGKPGWGDYYTSEFHVIKGFEAHPWEENRSLSHSYGYNWEESFDDRYVLTQDASLDLLLHVVADGGNLLLMVSPDGTGRVPPNQERRLRFLGQWLKRNGQAIYSTRAVGLKQQPDWGYLTRSKDSDRLYLIVRHRPADGLLRVPVSVEVQQSQVLNGQGQPTIKFDASGLTVDLHDITLPDPDASVIVIKVHGPMKVIP